MAAPAHGSTGTFYDSGSDVTTAAFPVPASVASGDIIVISMFVNGAATITAYASGFTEVPDSPQATTQGQHSLHVVWKRATGADSGTYDFTLSAASYVNGAAVRYTGATSSGTPWDITDGASDEALGTVSPAVSVTTTGDDRLLVWSASNWSGGNWTPPTAGGTWTERFDAGAQINTLADKAQAAAGSTGSVTGSCVGNDRRCAWLGAMMADSVAATRRPAILVAPSLAAIQRSVT